MTMIIRLMYYYYIQKTPWQLYGDVEETMGFEVGCKTVPIDLTEEIIDLEEESSEELDIYAGEYDECAQEETFYTKKEKFL